MTDNVIAHVRHQLKQAANELRTYPPEEIDWPTRASSACERLVPWLVESAAGLCKYVEHVMNSPTEVRIAIDDLLSLVDQNPDFASDEKYKALAKLIRSALDYETLLISQAGGTVVSKLIEKFLIENSSEWELESNGASDYPDLFFRGDDYSQLPAFTRGKGNSYGAATKGKAKRPVRIPDGLEIKTCNQTFAVDCHHAHAGLYLVLIYVKAPDRFVVTDIFVGFMRHELYRITNPDSPTTTLKASFNGSAFVSVFGDSGRSV